MVHIYKRECSCNLHLIELYILSVCMCGLYMLLTNFQMNFLLSLLVLSVNFYKVYWIYLSLEHLDSIQASNYLIKDTHK